MPQHPSPGDLVLCTVKQMLATEINLDGAIAMMRQGEFRITQN